MTTIKTIVFGPTGAVGAATARSAHQQGAKVFLAMRDPQKPIPDLTAEQEAMGGYERVQADLTKPETISAAVNQTGAKHAFIYFAFGTSDNMKSSITALKSAGVEFVVFLSSNSIEGDAKSVPTSDFIAWAHAQVEINLEDNYGPDGYVTVRPNYFASNALWWTKMIRQGEVRMVYPDFKFDWISSEDIGRVCGTFLVKGLQTLNGTDDQTNIVRLCGPELLSQRDAARVIARAVGKDIQVTELDDQQGLEVYVGEFGLPEHLAKRLIDMMGMATRNEASDGPMQGPAYEEARENTRKYGGGASTKFHEWAEQNRQKFAA